MDSSVPHYFRISGLCERCIIIDRKNWPIGVSTNRQAISDFLTHPFPVDNTLPLIEKSTTQFLRADSPIRFLDPENLRSNFIKYRSFLEIPSPLVGKLTSIFLIADSLIRFPDPENL
jgi:hypothetical protein